MPRLACVEGKVSAASYLRPTRSLPVKIALFVCLATLVTSLAVTGISVQSIDTFLRDEIEQKFPAVLNNAGERLDLWYQQRELDMGVFAGSEILRTNAPRLGRRNAAGKRARAEVEQYLAYVLANFSQYEAMLIVDSEGRVAHRVGVEGPLPEDLLVVGRLERPTLAPLLWEDDRRLQVLRAPIEGSSSTLQGLLRIDALEQVLGLGEVDRSWCVDLLDEQLRVVASTKPGQIGRKMPTVLPVPPTGSLIADYSSLGGEQIVGLHRAFPRFGWKLAVTVPYEVAFAPVVSSIRRIVVINLAIVLTLAMVAFRVALSITRPIEALSEAAQRISEGGDPAQLPETAREDELGILGRAIRGMATGLANKARELEESRTEIEEINNSLVLKNDELQKAKEVFEQLSVTDGLTKLHNHRYFQDQLTKEGRRADRTNEPLALILADIDHFKSWNDELGHAAGDQILRQLAEVMSAEVRDSDLLARYGGEEFAVLAPGTDHEAAVALAERLRAAIGRTEFFMGLPKGHREVSASFGVAVYRSTTASLFEEADRALYAAKEGGRDCVVSAADLPPA